MKFSSALKQRGQQLAHDGHTEWLVTSSAQGQDGNEYVLVMKNAMTGEIVSRDPYGNEP